MKQKTIECYNIDIAVAPLAGAWIETECAGNILQAVWGRPPRGGVD